MIALEIGSGKNPEEMNAVLGNWNENEFILEAKNQMRSLSIRA
jgi:hypothetical protein